MRDDLIKNIRDYIASDDKDDNEMPDFVKLKDKRLSKNSLLQAIGDSGAATLVEGIRKSAQEVMSANGVIELEKQERESLEAGITLAKVAYQAGFKLGLDVAQMTMMSPNVYNNIDKLSKETSNIDITQMLLEFKKRRRGRNASNEVITKEDRDDISELAAEYGLRDAVQRCSDKHIMPQEPEPSDYMSLLHNMLDPDKEKK